MTKQIPKIKDYPLITLNVSDIKKDPTNPNNMTLEQINGLEKSIVNFGRLKYIVVDQDNILIDGEHRLEVEKANGTQNVQVIQVPVKNEIERKMMRETLNQLHGEYDKQKQSSELLAIFENQRLDELAELLGKPREEFENLITRYNPEITFTKEEDETKLPSIFDTESFVKRGEMWQLGRHKIMCGDSTNKDDIKLLLNNRKMDLVVTSPPYDGLRDYNKNIDNFNFESIAKNLYDIIIANGGVIVWVVGDETKNGNESGSSFKQALYFKELGLKLHDTMIYNKLGFSRPSNNRYHQMFEYMFIFVKDELTKFNPIIDRENITAGRHHKYTETARTYDGSLKSIGHNHIINDFGMRGNIWTYSVGGLVSAENKIAHQHPAIFPVDLAKDHVVSWSDEDDLILDPFLGSGSTLIACEQTNRICYGMEIDEHYCSVIIRRWEEYTNRKATKLNDVSNGGEQE